MKANDIKPGNFYEVTAGRNKTRIKVTKFNPKTESWECETESGKTISVKDSKRFLKEIQTETKKSLKEIIESKGITVIPKGRRATTTMRMLDDPTLTRKHHVDENGILILEAEEDEMEPKKERRKGGKPKGRMSGLDAAYEILKSAGEPMNAKAITDAAIAQGLWQPEGATPAATISAAIQREILRKHDASRFVKSGKGLFFVR